MTTTFTTIAVALITAVLGPAVLEWVRLKFNKPPSKQTLMKETIDLNELVDYQLDNMNDFLSKIDFFYHSGYGGQELFGNIWFKDGTWASRGEYDGSEWWEHHQCPDIPESLLTKYK
jgi:hypothetical protein